MLTNAPKGTKDIMMDQVYKWHYVEKKWKEICARYGFKELRTPIFEHTELFQRGVQFVRSSSTNSMRKCSRSSCITIFLASVMRSRSRVV